MGSNFNLGSIPEDMGLENMDTADLDTTLTEGNQGSQPGGSGGGMETDQLISSLGGELNPEMLQNILSKEQEAAQQQQGQQTQLWL